MFPSVNRRLWIAATSMLVGAGACSEPQAPTPQGLLLGGDATLVVDATTTSSATGLGSDMDPDGYMAWVDVTHSAALAPNGAVMFGGLTAGDHVVALYGIAPNCSVGTLFKGASNPRPVSLMAGLGGSTDFSLECGLWGGLFASTHTTGVDVDPDGFTITVDGTMSRIIPANGNATYTLLNEGQHTVAVSGIAGNCTLSGTNPRTVTVPPGKTAPLELSTSCVPTQGGTGTLTVTTTATGSNLDSDGYTVTLDGLSSFPIATTNGSVSHSGPAGNHTVALSGVASNCTVSGANPRTVAVAASGAASTAFSVACLVPQPSVSGAGQLGLGDPAPRRNVQTFDLDLRADLTGRFTFTDLSNIHPSGNPASLTTDHVSDPATGFTAFRNSSSVCRDPSRGVEFDALGREDEGPVVSYTVIVCDDGPQGSGRDFVSFYLPAEAYGRSGVVTSGDIVKK